MNWSQLFGLDEARHILIIEDKVSFAVALAKKLELSGRTVYVFAGVESIDEGVLTGIKPLTPKTPHQISLEGIEFCFLDHYFEGMMNGTSLTPILVAHQIKVCGMSSVSSANESMKRQGAVFAFQKDALGRLLGI